MKQCAVVSPWISGETGQQMVLCEEVDSQAVRFIFCPPGKERGMLIPEQHDLFGGVRLLAN